MEGTLGFLRLILMLRLAFVSVVQGAIYSLRHSGKHFLRYVLFWVILCE